MFLDLIILNGNNVDYTRLVDLLIRSKLWVKVGDNEINGQVRCYFVHGQVRMAKRKAEIFTIVESVANWFDASKHVVAPSEVAKGVANWVEVSNNTVVVSDVAKGVANWSETNNDTVVLSNMAEGVANWSEGSKDLVVLSDMAKGVANWSKAIQEDVERVDVVVQRWSSTWDLQ